MYYMNLNEKKDKKFRHILVREEIVQTLKRMGNAGDSFNDVLKKILEKNR